MRPRAVARGFLSFTLGFVFASSCLLSSISLVVGPGLTSLQMLARLSAVAFWLVLESRHGGTEPLCAVESAFQGCVSQSVVISVLGGGKWRHIPVPGSGNLIPFR